MVQPDAVAGPPDGHWPGVQQARAVLSSCCGSHHGAAPRVQLACKLEAREAARDACGNRAAEYRVTTARRYRRRPIGRQPICTLSAREPRSTTKRACFTTWRGATATSVAREVTLYLAVPSPSSSRLALPSLTASSSSVLGRARSGAAAATLGGPAPGPKTGRSWASPTTTDRTAGCWPPGPSLASAPCIPTGA